MGPCVMAAILTRQVVRRKHRRLTDATALSPLGAAQTTCLLGWRLIDDGHPAETPAGVIDFASGTTTSIREAVAPQRRDNCSARIDAPPPMWDGGDSVFDPAPPTARCTVRHTPTGADDTVGRTWEHKGMFCWFGPVSCRCGEARPTQEHLIFQSPQRPTPLLFRVSNPE